MAVGPIGNAIFVNQQTAHVASVAHDQHNRIDFQNMVAQAIVQDKEEKVLEVRPTEENKEVDPDKEHQKNEADQELQREDFEKKDDDEDDFASTDDEFPLHKLDIKV